MPKMVHFIIDRILKEKKEVKKSDIKREVAAFLSVTVRMASDYVFSLNLIPELMNRYENGTLTVKDAGRLGRLSPEAQVIVSSVYFSSKKGLLLTDEEYYLLQKEDKLKSKELKLLSKEKEDACKRVTKYDDSITTRDFTKGLLQKDTANKVCAYNAEQLMDSCLGKTTSRDNSTRRENIRNMLSKPDMEYLNRLYECGLSICVLSNQIIVY